MTKDYTCELCNKQFKQKIDYTRHTSKKTPCVSIEKIQEMTLNTKVVSDNRSKLATIFNYCLDVLRNNEHLTGDKALRTLAHILDLRLLEPRFGKEIDIEGYNYKLEDRYDDAEYTRGRLMTCVKFSSLIKENELDIMTIMKSLWDDILSVHPITKNIFMKGRGFDIQNVSTFTKIFAKINDPIFETVEEDILGEAYENVIKDVMTGKVLGQYFTPPQIKSLMIDIIQPKLNEDGTCETIFDPAMGTGGFLISSIRNLIQQSKQYKIPINWEFVRKQGIGGREAEADTYQLAVSNMLISTGQMFNVLEKGDSIRDPITAKYDIVLANPPFGIDGLIYDEFKSQLVNEYMPIKSNSAVPLFLQAIISILKVNGRCAVVLPNGKELFGKQKDLVAIREYLMKTCDLKAIYYLPPVFTHTSISTCIFHFEKKKDGCDVLELDIKYTKTNAEKKRLYKFTDKHQTTSVKFYNYNPENKVKHLIEDVPIEKIASNYYSLNSGEYRDDEFETDEDEYDNDIEIKTIEEVCEFLPKSKRQASYGKKDGLYPFFTSSQRCSKYCDTHDFNTESIIIGTGGSANVKYGVKYSCSTDNIIIKTNNTVLIKYLYYYLYNNTDILQKGFIGSALKHISKQYLKSIKIPIPPIKQQNEIVEYCNFIYDKCLVTSNQKINELKKLNEFCLNNQKSFGDNEIKTLGEVCEINYGTRIVKKNNTDGEYPVYGSGRAMFTTHTFNRTGFNILVGRFALSARCVQLLNTDLFLNDSGLTIMPVNNDILHKYMGYFVYHTQNKIYECSRGTAQKNLDILKFKSIKIPIPPIARQKEIMEYCEKNDALIEQLENEIKQNKEQASLFMTNILK